MVPLAPDGTPTVNLGFAPGSATPVNDPPEIDGPDAQSTDIDTDLIFSTGNSNLITVTDPDAASSDIEVTVTVFHGVLTLATTSGLSFTTGDGTNDATMTFEGTVTEVNAALDGLEYTPPADYAGSDTLRITVDDQGNTGTGGAKTARAKIGISVLPDGTGPGTPPVNGPDPTGPTLVTPPIGNPAAGGLTGNNPGNASGGPVRFADGTIVLNETDLFSGGFGVGWGHRAVDQRGRVRAGQRQRLRDRQLVPAVSDLRQRRGHDGGGAERDAVGLLRPGRHLVESVLGSGHLHPRRRSGRVRLTERWATRRGSTRAPRRSRRPGLS